ncbi:MAG: TIM barrel protein [Thermoleophilia bacterium]
MIRLSAHLSTLFPDIDPPRRPAAARDAGFAAVETWWPPAGGAARWIEAVEAAGLRAALVNADGGDLAAGERGFCNVRERAGDAILAAADAARVAVACGGGTVNLLVGRWLDGVSEEEQVETAIATVRAAADEVVAVGGRVVVEHLNPVDVDRPMLATPRDAERFVRDVGHAAVSVLFDAYHAHRAGLDPVTEIMAVGDVIGHVQYADSPGRGAPGTGEIDLDRIVAALGIVGYSGWLGLEFVPAGPPADWLRTLPPELLGEPG